MIDQVETSPAHRRRGLGSTVMGTLTNAAAKSGATTAVLGASTLGRALYTSLGWYTEAPLTGVGRAVPDERTI
ncbi:GNAT family N-acetyltransferase [Streptomyces sp. M19]